MSGNRPAKAGMWFRHDLRLVANPALSAASKRNGAHQPIPALLLLSAGQMHEHDWAPMKWDLLRRHLDTFIEDAAERGIALTIEAIDSWRVAAKAVKAFAREHQLTELHFNAEY